MRSIISKLPTRRNYRRGRQSVEKGYPWLTYGAIIALEQTISKDFRIIEMGCGGSTIFFSRRAKSVKTYDYSLDWINKVKEGLGENSNVEFIHGDREEFYELVAQESDEFYDLALVDIGADRSGVVGRDHYAKALVSKIRRGGYLVIDNYTKYYVNEFNFTGFNVFTFDDLNYDGRGTKIGIKL